MILLTLYCVVVLCFITCVSLMQYLAIQPSRLQVCSNKISCQLSGWRGREINIGKRIGREETGLGKGVGRDERIGRDGPTAPQRQPPPLRMSGYVTAVRHLDTGVSLYKVARQCSLNLRTTFAAYFLYVVYIIFKQTAVYQ